NASGLFNLMRNLGGAVGLAILVTQLNDRTDLHFERLREAVSWNHEMVNERLANMTQGLASLGSNAKTAALHQLAGLVRQQAMTMAFSAIFLLIAAVFIGALLLIPVARRPCPAGAPPCAHWQAATPTPPSPARRGRCRAARFLDAARQRVRGSGRLENGSLRHPLGTPRFALFQQIFRRRPPHLSS